MDSLDRRRILLGLACGSVSVACPPMLQAQKVTSNQLGTSQIDPNTAQTLQERVFASVLRIDKRTDASDSWGTGFLFGFTNANDAKLVVLVTNKHVFQDTYDGMVTINGLQDDGRPNFADHHVFNLEPLKRKWFFHPDDDVDLAILPIADLSGSAGIERRLNVAWFSEKDIPSARDLAALNPVENVIMPGFPGSFWDYVNNVPIIRRGTTATPPYLDFQGKREVLVDASIWPGSSGSPVVIMDDLHPDRNGDTLLSRRLILLGIIKATAVWSQDGVVAATPAPLADSKDITGYSHTPIPDGIGEAIKSSCLLDFKPLLRDAKLLSI